MTDPRSRGRRAALLAIGASMVALPQAMAQTRPASAPSDATRAAAASAHFPFGPVVPVRPMPTWPVTTHLKQTTTLQALAQGRLSALQLMFTGCSATCPIQGAIFAEAQRQLGASLAGAQFVSLSIDPLSDSPQALASWLQGLGARPGWVAAAPRVGDLDALFELLSGPRVGKRTGPDPHTGQVYFLNRRGELVYRSADLPPPEQIVQLMRRVAAAG